MVVVEVNLFISEQLLYQMEVRLNNNREGAVESIGAGIEGGTIYGGRFHTATSTPEQGWGRRGRGVKAGGCHMRQNETQQTSKPLKISQ